MKVQCIGKVVDRSKSQYDGVDYYHIVIEEDTQFPSRFRFTTKDAAMCGPADGFAAVGRTVTATGFCNSKEVEIARKDGNGKFKTYRVSFSLRDLADGCGSAAAKSANPAQPAEEIADDIPF